MIILIIALTAIAILAGSVVADEIRLDREFTRHQRERDARLRQLLGDIHKR